MKKYLEFILESDGYDDQLIDAAGLDEVIEALDKGANIHAENDLALRSASYRGNLEIVKYLVEHGADIHAENDDALCWANYKGNLDVIDYLKYVMEHGVEPEDTDQFEDWEDINEEINYDQKLFHAIIHDNLHGVKDAINKGADIHIGNDYALRYASSNGYFDIIKYLVENGADVHVNHDYALRWTSKDGYLDIVKYLVEHGADIHAENDDALRWAKLYKHSDIIKYLEYVMEHGVNQVETDQFEDWEDINEDVNYTDQLIDAAKNGHLEDVIKALNKGANIHAEKDLALCRASANGHFEIVEFLVKHGADIHADNDDALHWASKNGHLDIVKYLVEHGADIHAENDLALRISSNAYQLDVVKYLVEYIIENNPEYLPKIVEYVPQEYKKKYPWLFAAGDHGLLGFKHINP